MLLSTAPYPSDHRPSVLRTHAASSMLLSEAVGTVSASQDSIADCWNL